MPFNPRVTTRQNPFSIVVLLCRRFSPLILSHFVSKWFPPLPSPGFFSELSFFSCHPGTEKNGERRRMEKFKLEIMVYARLGTSSEQSWSWGKQRECVKAKAKGEGLQVGFNDASCRSAKLKGNLLSNMPLLIIVFIHGRSCTSNFERFKIAGGKCVSSLASLLGRIETGLAVA